MSTAHPTDDGWLWKPTREDAQQRLAHFAKNQAHAYAKLRNLDQGYGNHSGVSRLSPWIKHRGLLETEVITTIADQTPSGNTDKFIQEVFWRSYWKGWLQHRPTLWTEYKASVALALEQLASNPARHQTYERATNATTSIALFNNWVEELLTTGYLHNHSRMWFASIWIFTLRLPWQLGADFFYRNLLDGDAASNTLSWRWVAGLHTKGKAYTATRDNIRRNAQKRGEKFAAGLDNLAEHPEPLIEARPWPTQPQTLSLPSPGEAPENAELLVLHEDDLGYELSIDASCAIALAPTARSQLATASHTITFTRELLSEAVQQYRHATAAALDVQAIVAEAKRIGATRVVAPFAPIGPTSDALSNLKALLKDQKIAFTQIVRPYDRLVWPHATRGFFALNKKIPELLPAITNPQDFRLS